MGKESEIEVGASLDKEVTYVKKKQQILWVIYPSLICLDSYGNANYHEPMGS